jgi:catechol-2,3-dioxygenase
MMSLEDGMESSTPASWPGAIGAITLFVEDLAAAKRSYEDVFGLPVRFEDDESAVFAFGGTLINLLRTTAARELVEPATVAPREAGLAFSSQSTWMTLMRCASSWPGAG